jgi:hypothetical protein
MTFSCNAELISTDLTFITDKSEAYNDKFEDQGYTSLYMLENGKSSINNVNYILAMAVIVHILHRVLERYSK